MLNGDKVIWVPLRSYKWTFSGTATNAAPTGIGWGMKSISPTTGIANVDATNEPTWAIQGKNNWDSPPEVPTPLNHMKSYLKLCFLVCCFTFPSIFLPTESDSVGTAEVWEQYQAQQIAVNFQLVNKTDLKRGDAIQILIKNCSKHIKFLPAPFNSRSVKIFFSDNKNNPVPLKNYDSPTDNVSLGSPTINSLVPVDPNSICDITISLSPSELAIVKTHLVFYRFYISDQRIGNRTLIESSPRVLTDPNRASSR